MNDVNSSNVKDQNVLSFMKSLVQEKYGDDSELEFLDQEADRLYELFGNNLVQYFEPMLTVEQRTQFAELDKGRTNREDQEPLLAFLLQSIPDLETQILQVLVNFKNQYLTAQPNQNTSN